MDISLTDALAQQYEYPPPTKCVLLLKGMEPKRTHLEQ